MERNIIDLEAPLDQPFPYDHVSEMYDIVTGGFGPGDLEHTFKRISNDISHDIVGRSRRALELTHSVLETNNQEGMGMLIEEKVKTATIATLAAYILPKFEGGTIEDHRLKMKFDGIALQEISGARALMFGFAQEEFRSDLTLESREIMDMIDIGELNGMLAEANSIAGRQGGTLDSWAKVNELERAAYTYMTLFAGLFAMTCEIIVRMAEGLVSKGIDEALYEQLSIGHCACVLAADEATRNLKKAVGLLEQGMSGLLRCGAGEEADTAAMLDWLHKAD